MTNLAPVSTTVEGLIRHLGMPDVVAKFPVLATLSMNSYEAQFATQFPKLDMYPVLIDFAKGDRQDSHQSEVSEAILEFSLTVTASQYGLGVTDAFYIADQLRMALNLPVAKTRGEVNWLKVERIRQLKPQAEGNSAFIFVTGTVRVNFGVQPY